MYWSLICRKWIYNVLEDQGDESSMDLKLEERIAEHEAWVTGFQTNQQLNNNQNSDSILDLNNSNTMKGFRVWMLREVKIKALYMEDIAEFLDDLQYKG